MGQERASGTPQRRETTMEMMNMTPSHRWEQREKEGREKNSGSSGQIIKETHIARNRWSYQDGSNSAEY